MSKNSELLNEADLRQWLNYDSSAPLEQQLRKAGIKFKRIAKGGGIVTTVTAVNNALAGNDDFGDIQFGEQHGTQARNQG